MTVIISTPEGITRYQMLVVKQGLKACKIGMRVNRDYTPTNLRKMVERWTKAKFKARDYDGMIKAVEELIAETKEEANV
jgi:hypothetical protein